MKATRQEPPDAARARDPSESIAYHAGADPDAQYKTPGIDTAASAQIASASRTHLFKHVEILLVASFRIFSKTFTSPRGTYGTLKAEERL